MSIITTAQSGYEDVGSTYVGGSVPSAGDVIARVAGHVITVQRTTPIYGEDTADDQWAITGPASSVDGGGWVIESDAILRVAGGIQSGGGPGSSTASGRSYIEIDGSGKIQLSGSYRKMIRLAHQGYNYGNLISNGSAGNWAEIENIGSGSVSIEGGGSGSGSLSGSYLRCTNIDGGLNRFSKIDIDYWIWDEDCGHTTNISAFSSQAMNISHASFLNPSANIAFSSPAAPTGGVSFDHIVWLGSMYWYANGAVLDYAGLVALGTLTGGSQFLGTIDGSFINTSPLTSQATLYSNCFYLASGNNHHFQYLYALGATVDRCVFKLEGDWTDDIGDCTLAYNSGASAHQHIIKNCLELPNDSGRSTGVILTMHGNSYMDADINNCTIVTFAKIGEDYAGHAGILANFVNNILHNISGSPGQLINFQSSSVPDDAVTTADCNCAYGASDPYNTATYARCYASTPGVNDIDEDPDFYDSDRDLDTWAVDVLESTSSTLSDRRNDAKAALAAQNDPESTDYHVNATVENLLDYLYKGFTPQNLNLATAGIGGDFPNHIGSEVAEVFGWTKIGTLKRLDQNLINKLRNITKTDLKKINNMSVSIGE